VADRSKDEPGSWRSDAGHYLSPAENLAAGQVFAKARDAEPYVTRDLLAIEADTPQARMEGLEFRLKEENRCKEKVAYEFREKPGRTVEQVSQAAGRMPDTLRYTYTFCAQDYAAGQQAVRAKLEERGYELVLSRNSWDNPQYKGLNTRWGTASGQVFEVQFHTPDSFDGKQLTHNAYERLRLDPDTEEEGPELREYQRVVTSYIAVPEGAATIPDYRREGY
jgi:hypothetical protein